MKEAFRIGELTTAASIWTSWAIGVLGIGFYPAATLERLDQFRPLISSIVSAGAYPVKSNRVVRVSMQ